MIGGVWLFLLDEDGPVGDELVVGEEEAEDVRVHDYDGAGVGAVADYVGVEAVEHLFFALGGAIVDGALEELFSIDVHEGGKYKIAP